MNPTVCPAFLRRLERARSDYEELQAGVPYRHGVDGEGIKLSPKK